MHEIIPLITLKQTIDREIESLKRSLCSFQIGQLRAQESRIQKRVDFLRNQGLYDNYGEISRLTGEIRRIQSRISTLEVRQSMGDDIRVEEEIRRLEEGVDVWFEFYEWLFRQTSLVS